MDDFRSTATIEALRRRASLLARVRTYFDARGFFEVQTPVLSADIVVDRHIDPVAVHLPHDARSAAAGREMWLQTSPEFAMKRLLASGADCIYQIGPAFRVGESGSQHNPEFTMLEWYRCGDSTSEAIQFLSSLVAELLDTSAAGVVTMRDAFKEFGGFDPFDLDAPTIARHCTDANVPLPDSLDRFHWDDCFDIAFAELVQPRLGRGRPTIVQDYPASQAALARVTHREGCDVADRFELFVEGVELANGYNELLDADELVRRTDVANEQRSCDGKHPLPSNSRLVCAMQRGFASVLRRRSGL